MHQNVMIMLMQQLSTLPLPQKVAASILPIIFAITFHEAAHGYVAKHFGDTTAYMLGRVSLNPLRHIDPIGTILLPLMTMLFGGILFGWAKPVPVNFNQLRNPKKDMLWVALAGPMSNLIMAIFWALIIRVVILVPNNDFISLPLAYMGAAGVLINCSLMALNLLPILPLDGGRIAVSLLPHRIAYKYSRLEPYGMILLLILLFTEVLGKIMWPLIGIFMSFISLLLGF